MGDCYWPMPIMGDYYWPMPIMEGCYWGMPIMGDCIMLIIGDCCIPPIMGV